ncbi:hypothetical protein [Pseudoclavibacter albus]|uniref:hypothetical protein n=1 Tax=Pseudoclavibacter albus TaxID=272241 RepID=UPI001F156AA2|nr:hypothetical protein [Pseudoclavibacter alba]
MITELTSFVQICDQETGKRLDRLPTSRELERISTPQLDVETKKRLSEIEKTLASLAEVVTDQRAVMLPGGQRVSASQLEAYAMVERVCDEMKALISSFDKVTSEVARKNHVTLNHEKVAALMAGRVASSIEASMTRTEANVAAMLADHEARLTALTSDLENRATASIKGAVDRLEASESRLSERLKTLTWRGIGQLSLALVPFALVAWALAAVLGLAGEVFGVGPLARWAWGLFEAAPEWWQKLLLAGVALGAGAALIWLVYRLGRWLSDKYRGW